MDETIMNFDGNGDITNLNENDKIEISKECKTNKTGSKCNMFLTKQELAEKEYWERPENIKHNDLYPTYNDPNFNNKIAHKKEFKNYTYDGTIYNIEERQKQLASIPFELSNHQKFVKNFLSSQTPYNSLLLFHGLGTGKTCSSISICEEMRAFYINSNIKKSIYIVASANIQENFRLQLFNPHNLIKTDGIWKMKANCVGSSLLMEAYPLQPPNLSKKTIVNKINGIINLTYTFVGYIQFSNHIESMFKNVSNEQGIRLLKRDFDNKMVVIDEAHNIRSSENMDSKKVSRTMRLFIKSVNNLKLVLLTATPMFNSSKEIVELLNLLNLNEKRALITNKNVFDNNGKLSEEGKEQIINKSRGVVSFIRGDNPYTFPLRIYPTLFSKENTFLEHTYPDYQLNSSKVPHHDNYILNTLYLNTLLPYQLNVYQSIVSSLLKSLNNDESDSDSDLETQETVVESKKLSYSLLLPLIESLFIVYPPDISNPDDTSLLYGKRGFNRIMKHNKDADAGYGTYSYNSLYSNEPMFRYDNIGKYSVKIKNILDSIYNPETKTVSDGIIIIYCEFIESGIIPIILALEERGMSAYDKNASLLLKKDGDDEDSNESTDTYKVLKKYKYITITGNQSLSYNKSENIQLSSSIDNMNGDIIKVILISRAGSEGIDFKFIRQIHSTTPWYNMNRMEQINGRGVRNLSHKELPPDKRNVSIYLHASILPDELNKETSDLYMYRFSENKAIEIGKIIRLLKENAVDCELNKEQFNFSKDNMYELNKNVTQTLSTGQILKDYRVGDEPYSSVCDYMKDCAYSCTATTTTNTNIDDNNNTYNTYYMESNKSQLISIIKDLFRIQYIYTDEELINAIHNKNKSYLLVEIYNTLMEMVTYKNAQNIIINNDRIGYIVNIGKYYLFTPENIVKTEPNLLLNNRPVDKKNNIIHFVLSKPNNNNNAQPMVIENEVNTNIPVNINNNIQENKNNESRVLNNILVQINTCMSTFNELLLKSNYQLNKMNTYLPIELLVNVKSYFIRKKNINWEQNAGYITFYLAFINVASPISLNIIFKLVMNHIIDILTLEDKLILLNYLYANNNNNNNNNNTDEIENTEFNKLIDIDMENNNITMSNKRVENYMLNYFENKIIIDDNNKYILFHNTRTNNPNCYQYINNMWELVGKEQTREIVLLIKRTNSVYTELKNAETISYIDYEKGDYIYKLRQIDEQTNHFSIQHKGSNCIFRNKKQHAVLWDNELTDNMFANITQIIDLQKILTVGQICVFTELLYRAKQMESQTLTKIKTNDNDAQTYKNWFYNYDEINLYMF